MTTSVHQHQWQLNKQPPSILFDDWSFKHILYLLCIHKRRPRPALHRFYPQVIIKAVTLLEFSPVVILHRAEYIVFRRVDHALADARSRRFAYRSGSLDLPLYLVMKLAEMSPDSSFERLKTCPPRSHNRQCVRLARGPARQTYAHILSSRRFHKGHMSTRHSTFCSLFDTCA